MRILNIDTDCTDNGIGLRTTVYIAGCTHHCNGCHNLVSWNQDNGTEMSIDEIIHEILDNELCDVTISGGDGLTHQYHDTIQLLKAIRTRTDKNIWLYTGYTFDQLLSLKREALDYIDVLVDGRFEKDQRDLEIMFRGSRNQRIIDVKESLSLGTVVLWKNGNYS